MSYGINGGWTGGMQLVVHAICVLLAERKGWWAVGSCHNKPKCCLVCRRHLKVDEETANQLLSPYITCGWWVSAGCIERKIMKQGACCNSFHDVSCGSPSSRVSPWLSFHLSSSVYSSKVGPTFVVQGWACNLATLIWAICHLVGCKKSLIIAYIIEATTYKHE